MPQTLELENFATAYRSSKRVVDFAQQAGRRERAKLDRRRSVDNSSPATVDR